jgi:lipoprotein-releasing system permease protein
MYKLLLCWRYLCTRYIALVSIVSVILGVWAMIVVNSVMEGFSSEMQNRIHGILSDVVLKSRSLNGMRDAQWHMNEIRRIAGDSIEAMTPMVMVPALLNFKDIYGGQSVTQPVQLIGIDESSKSAVSDFGKYLQHKENRKNMSWILRDGGYDVRDHQLASGAPERPQMADAGWKHRKTIARNKAFQDEIYKKEKQEASGTANPPGANGFNQPAVNASKGVSATAYVETVGDTSDNNNAADPDPEPEAPPMPSPNAPKADPFASHGVSDKIPGAPSNPMYGQGQELDMATQQHTGIVLGLVMASRRYPKDKENPMAGFVDHFHILPGDDVALTTLTVGQPPKFTYDNFTVVDFYESKMSEYDASFAFVPIRKLQELRGMIDPSTGIGMVNNIQIKLKPGVNGEKVRDKLADAFPGQEYLVETWRDEQLPLLAAVSMETAILNVLLFLIIAVAGFGILAIFYMIVVEKTRDIGILKSLGASSRGVMGIFLSYGLLLGIIGSGMGLLIGLLTIRYINEIADLLGRITGRPVFDPTIYYFYKIPTIIVPRTVAFVVIGAVGIAVAASILPALRAARLHPVEALRHE